MPVGPEHPHLPDDEDDVYVVDTRRTGGLRGRAARYAAERTAQGGRRGDARASDDRTDEDGGYADRDPRWSPDAQPLSQRRRPPQRVPAGAGRDDRPGSRRPDVAYPAEGARPGQRPPRGGPPHGTRPADRPRAAYPGYGTGAAPVRRKPHTARRVLAALLVALLAWIGITLFAVQSAWAKVKKVPATASAPRAADGAGRNVLLVGSDSRGSLTREEIKRLGTGGTATAEGARTDSIMVLHLPDSGKPTLVSFPRDSYVPIPGHGSNKINAAYSIGGPRLLASTIEQSTGLRIDGYTEIGFGGFASVVDAVGGVRMCLKAPMKDEKAHINLKAGCQTLDGKNALGYVRARYSDPEGDLGRAKRQRQFLGALMSKVAQPGNVLLPWRLHSLGGAVGNAIAVGEDDSMWDAAQTMLGLRKVSSGGGYSVTVPVADNNYWTPAGSSVKWDTPKAKELFRKLNHDEPLSSTAG